MPSAPTFDFNSPVNFYVPGEMNPYTGKPFTSQEDFNGWNNRTSPEYQAWTAGQAGASRQAGQDAAKAAATAGPAYDWSHTGAWTQPTSGEGAGNIYFGPNLNNPGAGQSLSAHGYQQGYSTGQGGYGYIDPKTGKIYYNQFTGPGKATQNSRTYDPTADYGLGSTSLGVIPVGHNQAGTPTAFYAGMPGGGGQVFTDLASAQQAAKAYADWYKGQHPEQQPVPPAAPQTPTQGGTGSSAQTPGLLTKPGAGEDFFDSTKGFYTSPTQTQQTWGGLKWNNDQPTESEQYWQKWSGIFNDPNYLSGVYQRGAQQAQNTLDRKASSAGWGDSGAAARATAGIGLQFTDASRKAMGDWATTGAGLAGQADASKIAAGNALINKNNAMLSGANTVDSGQLARLTSGQTAANGAENLMIGRETGGLNSAITLGQAQSALAYSGLSQAQQNQLQMGLAQLGLQMQSGKLSADQAYQNAQSLLASMGAVGNSAANWYITQALMNKGGTGGTLPTTTGLPDPYDTQTPKLSAGPQTGGWSGLFG